MAEADAEDATVRGDLAGSTTTSSSDGRPNFRFRLNPADGVDVLVSLVVLAGVNRLALGLRHRVVVAAPLEDDLKL